MKATLQAKPFAVFLPFIKFYWISFSYSFIASASCYSWILNILTILIWANFLYTKFSEMIMSIMCFFKLAGYFLVNIGLIQLFIQIKINPLIIKWSFNKETSVAKNIYNNMNNFHHFAEFHEANISGWNKFSHWFFFFVWVTMYFDCLKIIYEWRIRNKLSPI